MPSYTVLATLLVNRLNADMITYFSSVLAVINSNRRKLHRRKRKTDMKMLCRYADIKGLNYDLV